ncbi:aquaporin [Streptomyces pseudovenezuelae]|uniref:Aquaporin n=1 Tax=Streptomyces pseudovenezuelae TaxID=67350 RepID=A0ABZ1WQ94_9ACTN|nr:aquaporin [Streptomyces pseudovenezuelae]
MSASVPLARRAAAEAVGTAALVAVVVGSGIQASELTRDIGVQLLANSLATVFGLGVLIALLGPVSGAHFNPVVTLAAWFAGRRTADGPGPREVAAYVPAQIAGGIAGAVLADAMFARPLVHWSTHDRSAGHLWLGEVVATAGLVWLVLGLARAGRAQSAPVAVASYIGAAYWFTSSTSFANPAVTIGRAFTDTFAGIAPSSVAPFLAAQLAGAGLGLVLVAVTFGRPTPTAGDEAVVLVPHGERQLPSPARPARPAEESAVSS